MSARYSGGYHKNSRHVSDGLPDPARINVPADLETVEDARLRAPERVARLNAAGYVARLVHGWRVFVATPGSLTGREIRTPSEFAALLAARPAPAARQTETRQRV